MVFPVSIPWDSCFRPTRHVRNNQHPLFTQFCPTNDSVGWLPVDHLLVLLQRPQQQQQQQQQQQHVLLQHLLSSKITPVQAVIFWRRLPRYSSSSLHPRYDIDTYETSLQLSVGRRPLSGPTPRSCTRGSVRGTNQGNGAMLLASPRRQGVSSLDPQRYQGLDPTFAQKASYYSIHPGRFPRNVSYERTRSLFLADNEPVTHEKRCL